MRGFLIRVLIVAAGLWVASKLVPGVEITDGWSLLWAALLLGIVNAIVRPVIIILTLPLTILTLGLFLLIINAGMLSLVAWMLDGMTVAGFWPAFFGAIVVSITAWLASSFIGDQGRVERIDAKRI
jgi:putative membrane protein